MIDPSTVLLQTSAPVPGGLWPWLAAAVVGYLLGSIPFGLILTRAAGLGDVRNIGSGNIGATNVLRTGNKGLAAATLLLDGFKATAAVLLVDWVLKSNWGVKLDYLPGINLSGSTSAYDVARDAFRVSALAGAAAVIGHIFPVWLGFKGGKGVATYIGAMLGVYWPFAAFFCGVWVVMALLSRISSLAALTAAVLTPVYVYMIGEPWLAVVLAALSALLIAKHHANIKRLLAGKEPRIGAKK